MTPTPKRNEVLKRLLPEWKVIPIGTTKLGIQCPYKNCGGKAVVHKRWAKDRTHSLHDGSKLVIIGRSCTYCMKTSRVPAAAYKRKVGESELHGETDPSP